MAHSFVSNDMPRFSRRRFVAALTVAVLVPATAQAATDLMGRDAQFRRILGRDVQPPAPVGRYLPAERSGNFLFVSTTVAREAGVPRFRGTVGGDLTLAQGQEAARLGALAMLETVQSELGGTLDSIVRLVNMTGYVVSAPGFYEQAAVMDGASALMIDVLGAEAGTSSRSAVGVAALTGNAAVAVSGIFEVKP